MKSRALPLKLAATAAALGCILWAIQKLPLLQWVTQIDEQFAQLGPWGAVVFPFFYATCNILLLPGGSLVAASGGFFFGLVQGTFLILAGNLIGAAIAFLLARTFGRRWLETKIRNSPRWSKLDAALQREGPKIVFLTQLHPLFPTSILNYFYGVTQIRFWPCLLWVALGQLPSCIFFAFMGAVSHQGLDLIHGKDEANGASLALWGAGLLLTLVITILLGRMALKLLAEIQEKPVPEPEISNV